MRAESWKRSKGLSALIAPPAGNSTVNPDGAASPADEANESPAALRIRLQTRSRMISYRHERV